MLTPGATKSRISPSLENEVRPPNLLTAPTAITLEPQAGAEICSGQPLLPEAATTTTPLSTALLAALVVGTKSQVLS